MSIGTVEEILRQIDALPEEDRRILEERLAAHAEAEWQQEAEAARRVASDRGLDQAAVDAAVQAVREGSAASVEVVARPADTDRPTLLERLQSVVGVAEGLPADAASNVDHYLYGHPKS